MTPRALDRYRNVVVGKLTSTLGYTNSHAIPRLTKIVINMGVGAATQDRKRLEEAVGHLRTLSGQKPQVTKAKASISGFRLREGQEIGCMVTLRGARMFEFFDRLVSLALPRVRDFRGLNPKSFDGRGNFTLGLSELLVFPEIDPDKVHHQQGMHITIVTTATNDNDARVMLREMGLPMRPDAA
ncbi:MAG: ribosomal protein [Planctomycetaceae bacterium]|nr:ribosomal protein [Planctomycetaceae bacterium]